jgi:hypothetical protein
MLTDRFRRMLTRWEEALQELHEWAICYHTIAEILDRRGDDERARVILRQARWTEQLIFDRLRNN